MRLVSVFGITMRDIRVIKNSQQLENSRQNQLPILTGKPPFSNFLTALLVVKVQRFCHISVFDLSSEKKVTSSKEQGKVFSSTNMKGTNSNENETAHTVDCIFLSLGLAHSGSGITG